MAHQRGKPSSRGVACGQLLLHSSGVEASIKECLCRNVNKAAQARTWPANKMSPLCRIGHTTSSNSGVAKASHKIQKCESRVCATTLFMLLLAPGTTTHKYTESNINGYGTQALGKVNHTDSEQATKRFTVLPDNNTMIQ
ncbi:hypothetical protein TRVL_08604 [Trypanosoma vivax]|nr:hypothetical protein TRVL_08604 [Trypanosoma vivax]